MGWLVPPWATVTLAGRGAVGARSRTGKAKAVFYVHNSQMMDDEAKKKKRCDKCVVMENTDVHTLDIWNPAVFKQAAVKLAW